MRAYAADDYVLGNDGDDKVIIGARNAVASGHRSIDCGLGHSLLELTFGNKAQFHSATATDGGINLTFDGNFLLSAGYIGTIFRIENYLYRDQPEHPGHVQTPGANASAAVMSDGTFVAQDGTAVSDIAPSTMTVDPSFDYADGGDGDLTVIGTSGSDIVYLGHGNKTVQAGGGDDTIIVRADNPTDQIVLDGGTGADHMIGCNGIEAYYVDNIGDEVVVDSPGGHHTIYATARLPAPAMISTTR